MTFVSSFSHVSCKGSSPVHSRAGVGPGPGGSPARVSARLRLSLFASPVEGVLDAAAAGMCAPAFLRGFHSSGEIVIKCTYVRTLALKPVRGV